jgi:hypothetical protein
MIQIKIAVADRVKDKYPPPPLPRRNMDEYHLEGKYEGKKPGQKGERREKKRNVNESENK